VSTPALPNRPKVSSRLASIRAAGTIKGTFMARLGAMLDCSVKVLMAAAPTRVETTTELVTKSCTGMMNQADEPQDKPFAKDSQVRSRSQRRFMRSWLRS